MSAPDPSVRVLLVEDDEVDRMAVRRALKNTDLSAAVVETEEADSALSRLRETAFDCVISDLQMPGHDGRWLLQQARAEKIDVPFIMLTGHGDEAIAVDLMKAGASDYLAKPNLTAYGLSERIRRTIRIHQAEREAARAERNLRASEERLRLALDATNLGTWDYQPGSGMLDADARTRAMLGLAADRSIAYDEFFQALHSEDRARAEEAFERAMSSSSGYDVEFRTAELGRWIRATGRAFFEGGKAVRLIGTVQDVSALKESEEERRRRAEFDQQMIGIVSHDLKNPISAMIMAAQVLKQRASLDPKALKTLNIINTSGERATRLIRDLLDFTQARIGGGLVIHRQAIELGQVVSQVLEELRLAFPDRLIELESSELHGDWDPDRLAQIVINLVTNALVYSPSSSVVRVAIRSDEGRATIEVHNSGDAIPPERMANLFEPCVRGPHRAIDKSRSIGLGLFIVRELVAAHGGSVSAESTADRTTFRVSMPVGGRCIEGAG